MLAKKTFITIANYVKVRKRVARLHSVAKHLANTVSNHEGETLQRWRAVGNTASNLNSLGIKPCTSHTKFNDNKETYLTLQH